jgi:hypothetical protein
MTVAQPAEDETPAEIDIVEEWGEQRPAAELVAAGSRVSPSLRGRASPTHGAPPSSSTAGSNRPGQHPLQGPCPNRWVCAPMVALGLDRHGGVMTVTTCPTTPLTSPLVLRCAAAPCGPWLIQDRRHPGR